MPDARISKYCVPTILLGLVVLTHIFVRDLLHVAVAVERFPPVVVRALQRRLLPRAEVRFDVERADEVEHASRSGYL